MERIDSLQALDAHFRAMPPVAAMQLRAVHQDGDSLRVQAPLAANVNDKGCAFGGSLAGAMTLAGWGLLTMKLQAAGIEAEVYVADSQLRYLRPLYADLVAEARLQEGTDWNDVLRSLQTRGRARAGVVARVLDGDQVAAELGGRFAILRPLPAACA